MDEEKNLTYLVPKALRRAHDLLDDPTLPAHNAIALLGIVLKTHADTTGANFQKAFDDYNKAEERNKKRRQKCHYCGQQCKSDAGLTIHQKKCKVKHAGPSTGTGTTHSTAAGNC